jgi:hypothetical protein
VNIIPIVLVKWSQDDWVSHCISESHLSLSEILRADINLSLTSTGSSLLHLATLCAAKPSARIASQAIHSLLKLGANPNKKDHYDRTPLTNLVTQSSSVLHNHEDIGVTVLHALLNHHGDANALFTPDFLCHAGCEKWTLAHDLQHAHHGLARWKLPNSILTILNTAFDFETLDSSLRSPKLKQLPLAV